MKSVLPTCALVALAALTALAPAALAFKAGRDFAKPASAGGGGDILFTGAPVYRRWNCTACHRDAPGKIRIHLASEPPSLVQSRRYVPGAAYKVTIDMLGEHRGLGSALNTNGMAMTAANDKDEAAGTISGYAADELRAGNNEAEVVTEGLYEKRTSWSFTWTAPPAGAGPATFYIALVDGDGASTTKERTSDPLHDDVAVGAIRFAPDGTP